MSGGIAPPCHSILSSYLPRQLGCLPPPRTPQDHSPRASYVECSSSSSSPQGVRLAFSSDRQTSYSKVDVTPTDHAFLYLRPLTCHWSAYPTHIRTCYLPIGQLLSLQIRTSCLPIGQLSLFKELPGSLVDGLLPRSQPRRLCFLRTTIWLNGSNEV